MLREAIQHAAFTKLSNLFAEGPARELADEIADVAVERLVGAPAKPAAKPGKKKTGGGRKKAAKGGEKETAPANATKPEASIL
jgi:hypothetical protein